MRENDVLGRKTRQRRGHLYRQQQREGVEREKKTQASESSRVKREASKTRE